LVPCQRGLHATTADSLLNFLDAQLWRVEINDEWLWHGRAGVDRKVVARRMRLVERVEAWNGQTARLFAVDCAERVLPLYEAKHADDDRPRRAIETARAYARGEATVEELAAADEATARATAWAAARDAADATVWDAARDAVRAAARDAADATAWDAARDAAWDAAWSAVDAGVDKASRDAAWGAERAWQTAHLLEMLGLEAAL
jgi:hypothetical protein